MLGLLILCQHTNAKKSSKIPSSQCMHNFLTLHVHNLLRFWKKKAFQECAIWTGY